MDLDGVEKTALQIILEEVIAAGIEEVCVVVRGGSQQAYREAAGELRPACWRSSSSRPPAGLRRGPVPGGGVRRRSALPAPGERPLVHQPAAAALRRAVGRGGRAEECSVSAVQPTRESMLRYYGAVGGAPVAGRPGLYQIERVLEKPTPTQAEQELVVPGLRAGHYLCLFGMHVLTPGVMELLGEAVAEAAVRRRGRPIMLSPALEKLAQRERYLALELDGTRYNIGVKYGMFMAQLALALSGSDREEILARLVELLACTLKRRCETSRHAPMPHDLIDDHHRAAIRRSATARWTASAARPTPAGLARGGRPSWTVSAAAARTCTSGCGRSSSWRHLPLSPAAEAAGASARARIPFEGYVRLLDRRFEEAVDEFLAVQAPARPQRRRSPAPWPPPTMPWASRPWPTRCGGASARSAATSGCSAWGIRPIIRCGSARSCCERAGAGEPFPILAERTPVRMDLSHSGWSDIFFLGMDFPEGARVLNVSVDLGVRGRDPRPRPPIEVYLRVIDQPGAAAGQRRSEVQGRRDHAGRGLRFRQGLPGPAQGGRDRRRASCRRAWRARAEQLADVLARLVGPGLGLEIVSKVNDIPKGSRLAVSTNLLAAIITACMRATGQIESLTGPLSEAERKLVAARAILGEWLGGSGGGWQDSGGIWPGVKMIEGRPAGPGDPEFGVSRGRLLPDHHIYGDAEVSPADAAADLRQLRAGPRRHGPERRPDPGNGHREVPAPLGGRVGGPAGGHRRAAVDRGGPGRGDVREIAARHHAATSSAPSRRSSPGPRTTTPKR